MGPLRRCAVLLVLLLAAACGDGAGPAPDRVLSAAGSANEEPPFTVVPTTAQNSWYCGTAQAAGDGRWYTFPAPSTFRITATATVVNCMGGISGGIWIGPHFPPPQGLIGPWFPEPQAAVSAGMDVLHRPDRPPRPVGPPPGP